MAAFEYLSVLISIILALGMTRVLGGVGEMLQARSHRRIYLGPQYFISNALYFAGLTTAAITRNERYHEFYAIFFLVQTIVISFLIFQTLK